MGGAIVSIGRVVGFVVSSCGATSLPGWERSPVVRLGGEWNGGVKEAFDELTPVFLM